MCEDYQTIVDEITEYIRKSDKRRYSDFYIGITNDVRRRLFKEHQVKEDGGMWWIYRTAKDKETARRVERHFLSLGMKGNNCGGIEDTTIVYCYGIESGTRQ